MVDLHPGSATLTEHLERRLLPAEAAQVEAHLAGCPACTSRIEGRAAVLASLGRHDPDLEGLDLASRVAPRLGPARAPARRWPVAAAALAGLAVGALFMLPASRQEEFRSKGIVIEPGAWRDIGVYRLGAAGVTPVGASIHAGDELLFTYRNGGATPAPYLMIFGVDPARRVHWYHPAYQSEQEDPEAIPAMASGREVELAERIRHDLEPGRLEVIGLFSDRPRRVSEIEAAVRYGRLGALEDATLLVRTVEVRP